MNHLIKSYIRYIFSAKNQHGVHSPFVYELITKCFYDKKKRKAYQHINRYRTALLNNKNFIICNDFGAGSRVFKSDKRQISAITKNAGITLKRAYLLNRIISYFQIKKTLELGTSLGISTAAMAIEQHENKITTIEGCLNTANIASEAFKVFQLHSITQIIDTFENAFHQLPPDSTFDLIFIDGNHQKEATLNYFEYLLKFKHNDSIFIFDDIHWSLPMEEAWKFIKQHPEVTVTIDTFQWGLVFFRKEQAKEDFIIRI